MVQKNNIFFQFGAQQSLENGCQGFNLKQTGLC